MTDGAVTGTLPVPVTALRVVTYLGVVGPENPQPPPIPFTSGNRPYPLLLPPPRRPSPMSTQFMMKVTPYASFRNQVSANVLTYRVETATDWVPNAADMGEILESLRLAWVDEFKAVLSQDATYLGMKITIYDPVNPLVFYSQSSAIGAGPGTADTPGTEPSQVCGLISKRTIYAGRRGRGRFYMPFVPLNAASADDLLTNVYKSLLADLASQLVSVLQVINVDINTVLRPGISTNITLPTYKPWTTYSVAVGFATQRRRGFFGRPNVAPPL